MRYASLITLLLVSGAASANGHVSKNGLKFSNEMKLAGTQVPTLGASSNSIPIQAEQRQDLLDVYHQALAHDPTLASASSGNKAAQEIAEQGKALYRPTVNFNAGASASRTDNQYTGSGFNQFNTQGRQNFEGYTYGVEARQPIFRKQNLVQMDQAETQVSQADKQYLFSQQDLIVRTADAYFSVLSAQDKIDLLGAQKVSVQGQLDQAKATFEAGTATVTDVNEAQAKYDLIVAQEIAALNDYQIARRTLQSITGQVPERLATVKGDIKVTPPSLDMLHWEQTATDNNLKVQIQRDSLKLAEQEVERTNAANYPTLDAVASYNKSYANGGISGVGNDLKNGTISLQMQIPLYAGGAISSKARQAVLNKQKAQDDLEIAIRQANLDTQRAYLNLTTTVAQVKALEQALTSSQSQLESTRLGYDVGVRNSVEVLNAQQLLFSAKRDLLDARYNYLLSLIHLKAAVGQVSEADLQEVNQQLSVNAQ